MPTFKKLSIRQIQHLIQHGDYAFSTNHRMLICIFILSMLTRGHNFICVLFIHLWLYINFSKLVLCQTRYLFSRVLLWYNACFHLFAHYKGADCLMPCFLEYCCHCSASLQFPQLFAVSACLLFWALGAPYIQWLAMHVGIACLHFAYWESLSDFAFACWDSVSGIPGLWLVISDWCLRKDVCCKPGCDWQIFIICTMMGF